MEKGAARPLSLFSAAFRAAEEKPTANDIIDNQPLRPIVCTRDLKGRFKRKETVLGAREEFTGGRVQIMTAPYTPTKFELSGLKGISDRTLEIHFKLYEGYVKETNRLTEKISEILEDGRVDHEEMPAYSELTRRLGFEYNGMVLHEYYFGNLSRQGESDPAGDSEFLKAAEASFGRYEVWREDFVSIGKMRGVGWAICFQDPVNGRLSNHWVSLHEVGNVAGFNPLLVMDAWEHAYLLDYEPSERPKYIEAFMSNVDWNAVEERLKAGLAGRTARRAFSTAHQSRLR